MLYSFLLAFLIAYLMPTSTAIAARSEQVEYPTYYAHVNEVSIAYQEFGNPEDDTVLLIMGLGGQLIHWDDDLVWKLVDAGFHVVRFDNRDAGWSTKLYSEDTPGLFTAVRYKLGLSLNSPYKLDDMAADAYGLLQHLQVENAHVVGMSMGGMIAQIMAAQYPQTVKTLTSIMSSSGASHLPEGSIELDVGSGPNTDRTEAIAATVNIGQQLDGSVAELSQTQWQTLAARSYDRSYFPDGVERQLWAILDSGDRIELLKTIKQPTLVIHGKADNLLPHQHGEHTAELIGGSRLILVEGMGHFIDRVNKSLAVDEIIRLASKH